MATKKKAFDKDKWLAEKAGKIEDAKAALEAGLAALQTSDEWAAMLSSVARNVRRRLAVTRYSFGNQMLLAGQAHARSMPEPTSVGTFKAWERLGRSVKKGERGLLILTPKPWKKEVTDSASGETKERRGMYFGTAYVFDASQTEGDPIEEPAQLCRDPEDAEGFEHDVHSLRALLLADLALEVSSVDIRPRHAGLLGDHPTAAGWYCPATKAIVVIEESTRAMQLMVLAHEVAHALLHPADDHHGTPEREVEAQSTAFVVCEVLGLPTGGFTFPYVVTWASREGSKSTDVVQRSGDRIVKAATRILDAVLGKVEAVPESEETEKEVA